MEKKYLVPEGGLKAALGQVDYARAHSGVEEGIIRRALQDFVRWMADNPNLPSEKEYNTIRDRFFADCVQVGDKPYIVYWRFVGMLKAWNESMFLVPDPAIQDLLWASNPFQNIGAQGRHDTAVLEAYRRGKEGQ